MSRVSTLLIIALGIVIFPFAVVGYLNLPWVYYADRDRMMAKFANVHGITHLQAFGNDDLTYEMFGVNFKLAGRPDTIVGIDSVDVDSAGKLHHLMLTGLGKWTFRTKLVVYNSVFESATGKYVPVLGYGSEIDIGPDGEFANKLPFQISSIQDVVSHYDDLERLFADWPTVNRPGSVPRNKDGHADTVAYYCTTDPRAHYPAVWEEEMQHPERLQK